MTMRASSCGSVFSSPRHSLVQVQMQDGFLLALHSGKIKGVGLVLEIYSSACL